MMRRRAGLETNQTRRQLPKERQDITALQLTADDHGPHRIDAVNLKNGLCDVETDCRDPLHVWLLRIVIVSSRLLQQHSRAGGGAVHSIKSRSRIGHTSFKDLRLI